MAKMTKRQIAKREKTRNIGEEILLGIRDIKAGRTGRRFTVDSYAIVRAREQLSSRSKSKVGSRLRGNDKA
jgi:hypothetical protein